METLELVLLLLAAVLMSSVVSQFVSKVPTSLIQILMGLGIALLASDAISITLDPELFLVLFIAPLLYYEAREANIGDLWRFRGEVLFYSIGLVLAIVLIVGYLLHAIMPAIPLAAAFALGAALGPTDAVAVAAISRQTAVSKRNLSILKGEALLNDASGLVSFQFAVAAVATGGFSLKAAGIEFVIMFFGGLALGLACGLVINYSIEKIRSTGLQDTTFHVLLELFIPFIVYLLAEYLHVSGIIAVVVTGVVNVATPRATGVTLSRTSIVSTSVWKVLSFALNGLVFVMLGSQLPGAMHSAWQNYAISDGWLIAIVVAVTFALEAVRFVCSLCVEWISMRKDPDKKHLTKEDILSALTLTLSGAKGAITLSIMFTLPLAYFGAQGELVAFPYRDFLTFIASGSIILTLLLATFVVPLIAPKKVRRESAIKQHEEDTEAMIDILRSVIEHLNNSQTRENARATASVVAAYNGRIVNIKESHDMDEDEGFTNLKIRCIGWEKEFVVEQMNLEIIDPMVGYDQLAHLNRRERILKREGGFGGLGQYVLASVMAARAVMRRIQHKVPFVEPSERQLARRELKAKEYDYVIGRLQQDMTEMDAPAEEIASVILSYQRMRNQLRLNTPSVAQISKTVDKGDEVELQALRLELKLIQEALNDERMSRSYGKRARENVYLMQIDLEGRI